MQDFGRRGRQPRAKCHKMNASPKGIVFISLVLCTVLWACNQNTRNSNIADAASASIKPVDTAALLSCDSIFKTLKGATFPETIRIARTIAFSDSINKDTFLLIIPPGQITKTVTSLKIIAADSNIIYEDSFKTSYLVSRFYYLSQPAGEHTQEEYEKYQLTYINSITKLQFEDSALKWANEFFDNVLCDEVEIRNISKNEENIVDKELFNEITSSKNRYIWFPLFGADEGTNYIGYSQKRHKACVIMSSD